MSEVADGLPYPRRYWAIAAQWMAIATPVLDASIINVALPTIAKSAHASAAASIWVINAYQIAIVMVLLTCSALGDLLGYSRIYICGLIICVAASLGCATSDTVLMLSVWRFVQGLGTAAIFSVSGAVVRSIYPHARLGRGIGATATVVAICSGAGPSIGAAILSVASWRWLFALTMPLGLLTIVMSWYTLPRTVRQGGRIDAPSAVLNAIFFGSFFFAVSIWAQGQFDLSSALCVVTASISGTLLVRRARTQTNPLVPLDLLRVPLLRLSYLASIGAFSAQMGILVALPFHLQERFGFDRVQTGLMITPMPVAIALFAPLAGRLVERIPAGTLGAIGLGTFACGELLLALLGWHPSIALVVVAMALCGAGFALFQTPNNRTMISYAPRERSGAAGGMVASMRVIGQSVGAILVALQFRLAGPETEWPFVTGTVLAVLAAIFSARRVEISNPKGKT